MKRVYGTYRNLSEARQAVSKLLQEGYTRDQIKVISNKNLDFIDNTNDYYREDDRTLWEKIKDAFTFDEYDESYWNREDLNSEDKTILEGYRANLEDGEVVLLLEDGFKERVNRSLEDEKVLELKKEKLNVDKESVQTGEVDIKKVVKVDTQTVEVPIEKEEVVIERRPAREREVVDGQIIDSGTIKEGEEIHIPIREERVDVSKKTVVEDEIVIRKDKHIEDKTITEDVKREEIEVEGDARYKENLNKNDLDNDNLNRIDNSSIRKD